MTQTPLLPGAPRVLAHVRGVFSAEMAGFWNRLRSALREQNAELLLMADQPPEDPLDVPLLRYSEDLDAIPTIHSAEGWRSWLCERREFNAEPYLERQNLWYGPAKNAAQETRRMEAVHYLDHFHRAVFNAAQPALLILWNGSLPGELLLRDLAHKAGCPLRFMERGPFPGTVHLDDTGILAASRAAAKKEWEWPSPQERELWHGVMKEMERQYVDGHETWWGQPDAVGAEKLRKQLCVPSGKKIVLFAGQVDRDAQGLLFSPHFDTNLAAFRWFLSSLENNRDVFILGKHHPRSPVPRETFQKLLGRRGVWLGKASLADCLAVADCVAAVNSTVLYEGLMSGKPGLALGKGIFSGKEFLYEITSLKNAEGGIKAWLEADGFDRCRSRWLDFGAHFLATALYSIRPPEQAAGLRCAKDLAMELAQTIQQTPLPNYAKLGSPWPCIDEVALWHVNRQKEHEGFKEILRGANIMLKAVIARKHPRAYAHLVAWGNRLWDKFAR